MTGPEPDFRALFEAAPEALVAVRPDGPRFTIVAASAAWTGRAAVGPADVVGRGLGELLPDDAHTAALRRALERVSRERAPDTVELEEADGGWSRVVTTPVVGADGALTAILQRTDDLTELVRLRRAEAKASGILAIAHDAILCVDANLTITRFNRAAERLFGYLAAEVVGGPLDRLLPTRYHDDARPTDHLRAVGLRKSGEEFAAEGTLSRLEVDGEVVLTVALRDVTEQRRHEREQRFLADVGTVLASLDFDATLRNVVELAVRDLAELAVLFALDEDGDLRRVTAASRDPRLAWCADVMVQLPAIAPANHPMWQVLHSGIPVQRNLDPDQYETVAETPEHLAALRAAQPRSIIGVPLRVGAKSLGALFVASTSRRYDADDQRLTEALARRCALFIENARLHRSEQRAIQSRDDVLGIVAHDLRNPLGTILMQAGLLAHLGALNGQTRRPAEVIQRAARRMNRIIQDLLDVTRMESGHLVLDRAALPTAQVIAELVESQRAQLPATGAPAIRLAAARVLPEVLADRDRLHQILENLVGNALKFTPADGEITVGAALDGDDHVRLWVADTGPGIPPEHLPHLFDRFWQARRVARTGGVGLGLPIVKGLVEAHGGRVWVDSRVGAGSTFCFTLPCATARRAARRVLVAEDDADARGALVTMFERAGYDVVAVANGAAALAELHRAPRPALLVLDLGLPILDGWSVLDERARDPSLRTIPVIVASGDGEAERKVVQDGTRFLPKPVIPHRLLALVDEVIGH